MKKQHRPPAWADRIFNWYCGDASTEDLHGDLEELFYDDIGKRPVFIAKLKYWKRIVALLFSYAIKQRKQKASLHGFSTNTVDFSMFRNYFVIATRSLAKHKFFTIINVMGLAIGMSLGLILIAMLSFLWKYDNFHVHKDNIFRVISFTDDKVRNREYASAPAPVADKLRTEQPGIDEVVRINATLSGEVSYESKQIPVEGYFVDSNFFDVFTFPLVKGNATTALQRPNSIVITEKAAVKMFGAEDPFGKIVTIGKFGDFEITGVLKDVPKNSHMQFEVLGSYQTLLSDPSTVTQDEAWEEFHNSYVYLKLHDPAVKESVEGYLDKVVEGKYSKQNNFSATFDLQALRDIVPGRQLSNQIGPDWDYLSLSVFIILTVLILLPACFNYTNISISRALKRMKEIGLRKAMGGQRSQIFSQFILETMIITLVALCFSYFIFILVRREFLSMLVDQAALDLTADTLTIFYFGLFALVVGFIAGIVPALYFSKLNPIQALKSKLRITSSRFSIRRILIIGQFALSLGFIMSVMIVLSQYRQSLNYDFGFQRENILDVELQGVDRDIFRNEIAKLSTTNSISMSSHILGTSLSSTWVKEDRKPDSTQVFELYIDEHYIPNFGLEWIVGKNFTEGSSSNAQSIIVNEEFLKTFKIGDPRLAIDQTFLLPDQGEVTIIGVLKNFHYISLSEPIESFFFRFDPKQFAYANVKLHSQDMQGTLAQMESTWNVFGGDKKFTARFFDDEIEEVYSFYFSAIKICGYLGILAISISCLGLLGMVVFTVENRTKEVGVRKVMGASSLNLTLLLSKDFVKLMILAAMIATPLTYLFFDKLYLSMFYYSMPIGALEIIASFILLLVMGLGTVLSQTVRAAKANPVDTLRYE